MVLTRKMLPAAQSTASVVPFLESSTPTPLRRIESGMSAILVTFGMGVEKKSAFHIEQVSEWFTYGGEMYFRLPEHTRPEWSQ